MKKGLIRRIALNLAFFQMFSSSALASELVLVDNSNENNAIYQRYDIDTNEYRKITIFDKENTFLHQYGANQGDFRSAHFYSLIKNPIVLDEMKRMFPLEEFETREEATLFYRYYFDIIAKEGCGFAVAANYVFRMFEGKEKEFYNKFGYPMYNVSYDYVDFNYEVFMLKFFNYYIESNNMLNAIKSSTMRKVCKFIIEDYNKQKKKHRKSFDEFKHFTSEEYHKWKEKNDIIVEQINKYKEKINKYSKVEETYGIPLDVRFGNLDKYLAKHGIKIKCKIKSLDNLNIDDIIISDDYILYDKNQGINEDRGMHMEGLHYLYVSDITIDGEIIVSSWGEKYTFTDKDDTVSLSVQFKH